MPKRRRTTFLGVSPVTPLVLPSSPVAIVLKAVDVEKGGWRILMYIKSVGN